MAASSANVLPSNAAAPAAATASSSSPRDFDFLVGSWRVEHRRLKRRWVGSDDWDRFEGTSTCRGALGGLVNVDEIAMPGRGFSGFTLRSFDPARGLWSIYWINSTRGVLEPPVVGRFADGRGVFEGDDTDEGRAIRVRFVWDAITPESARWRQAFSDDGGLTWETNWVMAFTRVDQAR